MIRVAFLVITLSCFSPDIWQEKVVAAEEAVTVKVKVTGTGGSKFAAQSKAFDIAYGLAGLNYEEISSEFIRSGNGWMYVMVIEYKIKSKK